MTLLEKIAAKKNRFRIEQMASELIRRYENNGSFSTPSCEQDILSTFKSAVLDKSAEGLAKINAEFDYEKYVHAWVCRISFDLLASGRYHIYRGMLDPMSCADRMMAVYKHCMNYAVAHGEIPQEEMDDQLDYLHECIASVG